MDSGTKTWRNKLHKFRTQKRKRNGILCRTGGCCFLLFPRIFKHQMAVFETRPELDFMETEVQKHELTYEEKSGFDLAFKKALHLWEYRQKIERQGQGKTL